MKYSILISLFFSISLSAQTNYIPPQAFEYKETVRTEIDSYFNNIPDYNYVPGLIEHESCISLKHKKCWNPASRLKTSREEGAGLGQITRAFNADGSIRFDALSDMRNRYKQDLKDAKWELIYQKPEVQIRIMVLMLRDTYKSLYYVDDPMVRLHMTDAAYNGGLGGVIKERRACGLSKDCNPQIWFNNVERYCLKSKKVLYGNRSACDINRHHVDDVINVKLPKYRKLYFKET